MTDEALQAIRERAESVMGLDPGDDGYTPPQTWAWQMAAEDIPALLAEVERLRRQRDGWREQAFVQTFPVHYAVHRLWQRIRAALRESRA